MQSGVIKMWIVWFLIWYFAIGRNNPKIFKAIGKKLNKIIIFCIVASLFSAWAPMLLGLFFAASPFILLGIFLKWLSGSKKDKQYREETAQDRKQFNVEGKELVKAVPKRYKIVEKFNKKWNLYLTDEQIKTIVDASYVSVMWEAEIISMDKEYNSIYEWLKSDTAWLRAYLLAFNVQEVSSDFAQQREIAFQAFDQIFRETNFAAFPQKKYLLSHINSQYLTNFDDITFMTAYRFLQSEGRDYDIGNGTIVKNEDKIDALARKYS